MVTSMAVVTPTPIPYEMYLGYIDWMLKEKAKEDAEFQRQIEEYAEQGIIATVVEDEAAKWAVYAKSSV